MALFARTLVLLAAIFVAMTCGQSSPPKTAVTVSTATTDTYLTEIQRNQAEEDPVAEVYSPESKENIIQTGESTKNAMDAQGQTVAYDLGLEESQAQELTQTNSAMTDLNTKLDSLEAIPENALTEQVESDIISANEKMKYAYYDMQTTGQPVVPTIPSEVTVALAELNANSKAFSVPPRQPEPPPKSSTASQAERLLAKTPTFIPIMQTQYRSFTGDRTGAGDDVVPVVPAAPAAPKTEELTRAFSRLDKSLKKTEKRKKTEVPMFQGQPALGSEEFKRLEDRMKSLESTMKSFPSQATVNKERERVLKTSKDIRAQMEPKAAEPTAVGVSHSDIAAAKVKLMTELVKNLDELGRFFGEEEIVEEDNFLSIQDDPKIALAEGNLAAASGRLRGDLLAKPNRFEPDHRLEDVEHYLSHPVSVPHITPEEPANNLAYLRNLRNYVVSLKEKENRA